MTIENPTSVASHALASLHLLEELVVLIQDPQSQLQDQVQPSQVQDALGQYKVWGGNIGAFITGTKSRRSLHYRLREASQIKDQVIKLLTRLNSSLDRGKYPTYIQMSAATLQTSISKIAFVCVGVLFLVVCICIGICMESEPRSWSQATWRVIFRTCFLLS